MAKGVFLHRADSIYDDQPERQYQFPDIYLGRASQCIGDWIVYLEPSKAGKRGYHAMARLEKIVPDPTKAKLTGLKFINGGGRAEVEAAHIVPVESNGPDRVANGLALCGTVHWMFDRGLISLTDDLDILVSRQVNDAERITGMLNSSGKANLPVPNELKPHPRFLQWHREHCYKQ